MSLAAATTGGTDTVPHDTGEGIVTVTIHARRRWLERVDDNEESPRLAIAEAWRDGDRTNYDDRLLARVYGPQNAVLLATGAESDATVLTVLPVGWMNDRDERPIENTNLNNQ